MTRNILTVIPARGGSQGIKRKNMRLLLGAPLISYPIQATKEASGVGRLIVSTDDKEIAEYALSQGVEVPFMRPAELAEGSVTLIHVMKHALQFFRERGEEYDAIMSIQATTPALKPETINKVVNVFHNTGANAVTTVTEVFHGHPIICKRLVGERNDELDEYFDIPVDMPRYPRQAREPAYYPNGAVFLRDSSLLDKIDPATNCLGLRPRAVLMSREESVNIDGPLDFSLAEFSLGLRKR